MLEDRVFRQWFYFRVSNVFIGRPIQFSIANASESTFTAGWPGYNVCASYDRKYWFRVPSDYSNGALSWSLDCKHGQVFFAYFAPYSQERHADLIASCVSSPQCTVRSLGKSLDGRDIDLVKMGHGSRKIWVTARQHPGEIMAEWFMEGLIEKLLNKDDPVSKKLLSEATIYMVPNINPDGSFRGHIRTNAFGANLNREWAPTGSYNAPTLERSPEIYYVLHESIKTGCDLFLDIHGDEEIPHNFLTSMMGNPRWGSRLERLEHMFKSYWTSVIQH